METLKFKTNIKCSGCLQKVSPFLDEAVGEGKWEMDIQNPSKILMVSEGPGEAKILKAVQEAGFQAEKIR